MNRVIIESPYAGDVEENLKYARAAVLHALKRGESPIASHLLYTQEGILDDRDPADRMMGMQAGWDWMKVADAIAFYCDRGISSGMRHGLEKAKSMHADICVRSIRSRREVHLLRFHLPTIQDELNAAWHTLLDLIAADERVGSYASDLTRPVSQESPSKGASGPPRKGQPDPGQSSE